MPASGAKRRREGSWTGASLEKQQLMGALHADVAKRTVEERMKNPFVIAELDVIAELEPMTWSTWKRDRDEEPGPAQERERVPKRRKEDTRAAKLQWLGNTLALICGPRIVVLGRGI